jgi:hypothetical protein
MSKKLLLTRAKLQRALPLLRGLRRAKAQRAIEKITEKLLHAKVQVQEIDELGGLEFDVPSPPGVGRLVTLPFYPVATNADVTTAAGANVPTTQNPICMLSVGNTTANCVAPFVMQTPQISWADLRIVGFEIEYKTLNLQNASAPTLLVQNLRVGGGTNLFTHQDYGDASLYNKDVGDYAGLRDYPKLVAPDFCSVTIAAVSITATLNVVTFSASLVCDIIADKNYGRHLVGPYARGASLVRQRMHT